MEDLQVAEYPSIVETGSEREVSSSDKATGDDHLRWRLRLEELEHRLKAQPETRKRDRIKDNVDMHVSRQKSTEKTAVLSDPRRRPRTVKRSPVPKALQDIKTASLKDLLSLTTTTDRSLRGIHQDIIDVLKKLKVDFTKFQGGLECRRQLMVGSEFPSALLPTVVDIRNDNEVLVITDEGRHWREANEEESFDTTVYEGFGNSEALAQMVRFDLFIVKVPLRSRHGIRFGRGGSARLWMFNYVTEMILGELRLIWRRKKELKRSYNGSISQFPYDGPLAEK